MRTLRGALSGAFAATVWALQQPLDKRLFASRFDDVELLGKAVTRGEDWYPLGFAIHVANGAAFGAVYANVAPAMGIAPALRGPAAAMAENFERRVNREPEPPEPAPEARYSSNGHGSLEHAVVARPDS
jgi:hypothetical protein